MRTQVEPVGEGGSKRRRVWPPPVRPLVAAPAIGALAFVLRCYRLSDLLPVLVDEAIYLRWAEIIDHQGEWFVSLLDGKQPLSYWLLFAVRRLMPDDPLFAGRLISAIAGTLSTLVIFGLGARLAGVTVGALAALFYAVLPYAVLFDRIAYTDALANLCALLVAWTSYECFRAAAQWRWAFATAVSLSAGALVKTTVLQFALLPLAFGLLYGHSRPLAAVTRLAVIYAMPASLLLLTSVLQPAGPKDWMLNPVVHRFDFFLSWDDLAVVGLDAFRFNLALATSYLAAYVTLPVVVAAVVGVVCMCRRRHSAALVLLLISLAPLLVQMALLRYYPSRYLFAHSWLLAIAAAYAVAAGKRVAPALAALLLVPLGLKTAALYGDVAAALHPQDAAEFVSSGPYSGYGVREASRFLLREAQSDGFVLLTDPFWGPPADMMFVDLHGRNGIAVHEAWWLRVDEEHHPIAPLRPMPLMKSHYQRIEAGSIDFSSCCPRIFYVTDTNYYSEREVLARQPGAVLAARFMKRNGHDSIDVYRIR